MPFRISHILFFRSSEDYTAAISISCRFKVFSHPHLIAYDNRCVLISICISTGYKIEFNGLIGCYHV